MAFTDFLDLRTAVVEQVANPAIVDVMPRLVLLAEAWLNRRLRTRDMMDSATVAISGGTGALPSDFISAIGLFDASGREYVQQPVHMVTDGVDTGYFAIDGGNILVNSDGNKTLRYYAKIPTLTTSMTTTNWLLQRYPGLYLYAVSHEAAKYMRDPEAIQATKLATEGELAEALADDAASRYSRARIVLPGVTP